MQYSVNLNVSVTVIVYMLSNSLNDRHRSNSKTKPIKLDVATDLMKNWLMMIFAQSQNVNGQY